MDREPQITAESALIDDPSTRGFDGQERAAAPPPRAAR